MVNLRDTEKWIEDTLSSVILCISTYTHHHVERKRVLGVKVPQLAQNGKHVLLPHFDDDHFVDQNRDLNREGEHLIDCPFV